MHALMDRCFALLLDRCSYEGTVNQFTGDGIMAIFGAPVALEDAPRRAVLAALGIQRALAPLQEELAASQDVEFQMRIGIHSGVVVVGSIGNDLRMDYTAVGDTTNLAARLQAAAPAGSVLVSEATARLVSGSSRRDLGPRAQGHLGGASRVLGEKEGGGRLADAGLTPLAGRERSRAAARRSRARDGRGRSCSWWARPGSEIAAALRVRRRLGAQAHSTRRALRLLDAHRLPPDRRRDPPVLRHRGSRRRGDRHPQGGGRERLGEGFRDPPSCALPRSRRATRRPRARRGDAAQRDVRALKALTLRRPRERLCS
jgi:hypothetical protein